MKLAKIDKIILTNQSRWGTSRFCKEDFENPVNSLHKRILRLIKAGYIEATPSVYNPNLIKIRVSQSGLDVVRSSY